MSSFINIWHIEWKPRHCYSNMAREHERFQTFSYYSISFVIIVTWHAVMHTIVGVTYVWTCAELQYGRAIARRGQCSAWHAARSCNVVGEGSQFHVSMDTVANVSRWNLKTGAVKVPTPKLSKSLSTLNFLPWLYTYTCHSGVHARAYNDTVSTA